MQRLYEHREEGFEMELISICINLAANKRSAQLMCEGPLSIPYHLTSIDPSPFQAPVWDVGWISFLQYHVSGSLVSQLCENASYNPFFLCGAQTAYY